FCRALPVVYGACPSLLSRPGVAGLCVRAPYFVTLLVEGVDDVGLPALAELALDEVPHLVAPRLGDDLRLDGLPPGRQLVDDGRVEVAVDGEGEGTGDGRGRHEEDVRALPLPQHLRPLHDAEAVLL